MRNPVAKALAIGLLASLGMSGAARAADQQASSRVVLPETGYAIALEGGVLDAKSGLPRDGLVLALEAWICKRLHVPKVADLPHIIFATQRQLVKLRYRAPPGDVVQAPVPPAAEDIVALYDPESETVYLPRGWTGGTPAELSALAHELVHHVQHVDGMHYACPGKMEEAAFAAQQRLLALFGTDLEREFEIDPFTLLSRTLCLP